MIDPRMGVPSCSALYRLENCPASWPLSKQAEAMGLVPPAGEDADSGTRIHRALETGDFSELSDSERDTAERCMAQADAIIAEFLPGGVDYEGREIRIGLSKHGPWYPAFVASKPYVTGQADVLAARYTVGESRVCVIDYKTSRGEVTEAKGNAQLRGLAVLVGRAYAADRVRVAIVQPHAGPPSLADYDRSALQMAEYWLDHVVAKATDSDGSDPKVGDWCHYCPAKLACPAYEQTKQEAKQMLAIPEIPADDKAAGALRNEIRDRALTLPGDILARALDSIRPLEWFIEAAKSAARKRLESGEEIPGWEFGEKVGNRIIEDTDAASRAVAPLLMEAEGGPQAALLRCASLSACELTKEIRKAAGKTGRKYNMSEREAAQALEAALGDILSRNMRHTLQRKDELPEIETTETE